MRTISGESIVHRDSNTQQKGELLFPYTVAKEFPDLAEPSLIERKNITETIERLFAETPIVFLEGEEGLGATTTLAQFAFQIPEKTFSLFIKPASRITYTIEYLRLVLAEQFSVYLDGEPLKKDVISPQEYNTLLYRLRRRANKKNPVFFVIDGLHKIPPEENAVAAIFKEVLPIGLDDIKFLITGEQSKLDKFLGGTQSKYFQQLRFSYSESASFLESAGITEEQQARTIHALCDGVPGKLASVRRLLLSGTTLNEILSSDPGKYLSFIKLEFTPVDTLSTEAQSLLAIVTFSNRKLYKDELLKIGKMKNEDPFAELLQTCRFLSVASVDSAIEFASDGHRRFASTTLAPSKNFALSSQVEYLLGNPSSDAALTYLPNYYQQLDQTQELIRLLSSDHFTQLLELTESLGSLRSRAELGIKSAISLRQATDVFAFSIKRSIFASIANAEGSNSHIRALVALGDHQRALSIAYKSIANEERLAFLSAYAKQRKETTNTVDEEILNYIRDTAKKIDFAALGEVAIDLASEIVHVDPDLAMSIVDTALQGEPDPIYRDEAIARLSIESILSKKNAHASSIFQNNKKGISDEKLQVFISSMLALVSVYSSDEIIRICNSLEPHRQLLFLGYWMQQHAHDVAAIDVAEHGLNLMINNAVYAPKMRDLAALAVALPHSKDPERVRKLVDRFDSQRGIIKDSSASVDSVLLQMTLAHAESKFDLEICATRIIDCYYDLSSIEDNDTKLEALARLFHSLYEIDVSGELEAAHGFKSLLKTDTLNLLKDVLTHSAEHFLISKPVIASFAIVDFNAALEVAASLNTQSRRDDAYAEIIRAIHSAPITSESVDNVITSLRKIDADGSRDRAFTNFLQNLATRKSKLGEQLVIELEAVINEITSIAPRARCLVAALKIRANSDQAANPNIIAALKSQIPLMDSTYDKASVAFDACSIIATSELSSAKEFYETGFEEYSTGELNSQSFTQILVYCLTLTSRALGGAMRAKCFDDQMLPRFVRVAELIPSLFARIDVLSDLCTRAWLADRGDISKTLADTIIPLVDEAMRTNPRLGEAIITTALPGIYCNRAQIALAYIKRLSETQSDLAISRTLNLLTTKCPQSDPDSEERLEKVAFTYAEALDACALIDIINTDHTLYFAIKQIANVISSKTNTLQFTTNQKADIAAKLEATYRKKLPDSRNITHDGYVILCDASMVLIRGSVDQKPWNDLVERASNLTNLADKGFVYAEIASILPRKFSGLSIELQKRASNEFALVPSTIDKINRLIGLSDAAKRSGIALAKQWLKAAMTMTLSTNNNEHASRSRRRIIDVAEKIDPEFADELSELIDRDPAREHAKAEVSDRLKMLAVKKKLSNTKDACEISTAELQHLPEAAWKNVTGLIAGRVETKSPELLIAYLHKASLLSLSHAFPVLSWFIENSVRKYTLSRGGSQIEPLCETLLLTTELAANVMLKVAASNKTKPFSFTESASDQAMLGITNRLEALRFIGQWMEDCSGEIILCDPFFGAEERDLEFLRLVLSNCPECEVSILTSKKHLIEKNINTDELFYAQWREQSDQDPPATRIVGASLADSTKSVIHDRWLICGNRGLRLGTSFNGIGTGKLSEISRLNDSEIIVTMAELKKFLANERLVSGTKVSYLTFTI